MKTRAAALMVASFVAFGAAAQENPTSPSNESNVSPSVPAVTGYVTDPAGKAIEQAKVEIFLNSGFHTDYAVTDRNGFYIILVPQVSDFWEVQASADGFLPSSTRVSVYVRERVDFTLRPDPRPREERVTETRQRTRARKTMQAGLALARDGKRDEAIAKLREAVALDPDYAAAHNNLGVNLRLAADPAGAEDEFRRAIAISPIDYHANLNLGVLLLDTDRPHEAAPTLEQAVLADPTSAVAEALLGRSYLALGLGKRALEHLENAAQLGRGKVDVTLELSDAYVLSGDLHRALSAKEKWLAAHAADPRAATVSATIAELETRLGHDPAETLAPKPR